MPRPVLIGIGNSYRRDDGIGPALVAAMKPLRLPGVSLVISDGEPSQLLEAWSGSPLAVVVDAVLCEPPVPGQIHRTVMCPACEPAQGQPSGAAETPARAASTHGLGVPDAIKLATVLDRAPRRLVVFAVEAADIGFGPGFSAAVAGCLPGLTQIVLAELAMEISS